MSKATVKQVETMARASCFYVTTKGVWLRMQFCEDDSFTASDEETGNDYAFAYSDVDLDTDEFHMLVKMEVPAE